MSSDTPPQTPDTPPADDTADDTAVATAAPGEIDPAGERPARRLTRSRVSRPRHPFGSPTAASVGEHGRPRPDC